MTRKVEKVHCNKPEGEGMDILVEYFLGTAKGEMKSNVQCPHIDNDGYCDLSDSGNELPSSKPHNLCNYKLSFY